MGFEGFNRDIADGVNTPGRQFQRFEAERENELLRGSSALLWYKTGREGTSIATSGVVSEFQGERFSRL